MRLALFTFCTLFLLLASCNRKPDAETIRLYVRASDAYALGQFDSVKQILQRENNFPPALMLRTKAEYFSGDIERAEMSCRRVIKLRPSSSEARIFLARIFREKGDIAGAVNMTENILADNPQDIRTLRLAAELAMDTGKLDEAMVFLNRASEYSAESAMVLLDRARLRWIAGLTNDNVLEDLSRAKAMLPWDAPLLRSISNLEEIIRRQ
ncbi:MAG: tetratricopeptide repeat protein [Treponema sp.]|jgi:tetratricopeptide (TPR) repeat protein|nr:tetratricopeptide repeat protein [Treponema sp.]